MKVWMNKIQTDYTGGLLLVAANSAQEAHKLCLNSDKLEYVYWEEYWNEDREDEDYGCTEDEVFYPHDGWQEVPNLEYHGEIPCVIAEEGYTE